MMPVEKVETETGEPSSSQHMEKALSKLVTSDGGGYKESNSHQSGVRPETAAHDDGISLQGDSEQQSVVTPTKSNPHNVQNHQKPSSDHISPKEVPRKALEEEAIGSAGDGSTSLPSDEHVHASQMEVQPTPASDSAPPSTPAAKTQTPLPSKNDTPSLPVNGNASRTTTTSPSSEESPKQHKTESTSNSPKTDEVRSNGPPRVIHTETRLTPLAASPSMPPESPSSSPRGRTSATLRRGKWTVEEEAYVSRVIQDFNSGFLNAPAGTTLRSYLSDKLQCDPMRITKKFTGDACIGKRVFHPAVRSASNSLAIDKAQAELDALERRWRRRLEMQQRESAKKAAASAAAAHASTRHGMMMGVPTALSPGQHANGSHQVTQTASWLDRANAILKGTKGDNQEVMAQVQPYAQALESIPSSEIENQMKAVQQLIYEGPLIQQTTAGLPQLLHQGMNGQQHLNMPSSTTAISPPSARNDSHKSPEKEPVDKRMRTSPEGAEDAEALVGFLRSVRASAASGEDNAG